MSVRSVEATVRCEDQRRIGRTDSKVISTHRRRKADDRMRISQIDDSRARGVVGLTALLHVSGRYLQKQPSRQDVFTKELGDPRGNVG